MFAVAQLTRHFVNGSGHLRQLTLDLIGAGLGFVGACVFHACSQRGVAHAIGQSFPALDRDAIARRFRDQPVHGRQAVEVFNDDARVEQSGTVVHDQRRNFTERIDLDELLRNAVGVGFFQIKIQFFFGSDHAHFTRIWTGG